jgi:hypothetical protein
LLHWLDLTGQLLPHELPEQRLTADRLDSYCAYLAEGLAPPSIRSHLADIYHALTVLAPHADVRFIRKRSCCFPRTGDRLAKRARLPADGALLQLGFDLMSQAERKCQPTRQDAVVYRDGLIIALQAYRVMRLRNLASIVIGRHLVETEAGWILRFEGEETKNHRVWMNPWPKALLLHLRRYLETYRPMLLAKRYMGQELWISLRPGPLTDNGVYYAVIARTKAAFGASVNPHLFRDAAATSVAIHDPANVHITRLMLGHGQHRTSEIHYNQAGSIQASVSLNAILERRRRRLPSQPGRRG